MNPLWLLPIGVASAACFYAAVRGVPGAARNKAETVVARAKAMAPLTFFVHPAYLKATFAAVPLVLAGAVVVALMFGPSWAVVFVVVCAMGVFGRLTKTEDKLQEALRRQLPDAMEAIAANAKARSSLPTALREAAMTAHTPLKEVLGDVVSSYDRSVVFPDALLATAARVRCRELNLAFDIVSVCFRRGSPLDEVSRRLASSLRALHAFRTKIHNETSGARMGMRIMMVVPVAVLLMMSSVEGESVALLFNQVFGIFLLIVAGACLVTAWLWGRTILRSFV
jgi:Flp pilus assembly protein TadB